MHSHPETDICQRRNSRKWQPWSCQKWTSPSGFCPQIPDGPSQPTLIMIPAHHSGWKISLNPILYERHPYGKLWRHCEIIQWKPWRPVLPGTAPRGGPNRPAVALQAACWSLQTFLSGCLYCEICGGAPGFALCETKKKRRSRRWEECRFSQTVKINIWYSSAKKTILLFCTACTTHTGSPHILSSL